jgi:sugar lactone lactonase YvrE
MRRFTLAIAVAVALLAVAAPVGAREPAFPTEIPLADGFQPEGIAVGRGTAVFTGSLVDGTIWRGDLRTGTGDVLVAPTGTRTALGMDVDRRTNALFVAGGPLGQAYVYDASTGETLATYQLTSEALTLVNDVIVTRTAAWFTDSFRPVLYKVPLGPGGALSDAADIEEIPLGGDFEFVDPSAAFIVNANGIVATPDGSALIVVHTELGKLYRVDPATGDATEIALGGAAVPNGDGLVLRGRTLYVVQNFLNQIGVVELDPGLAAGTLGDPIASPAFRIPTTADVFGSSLYAVNARFDVAPPPLAGTPPSPDVAFEIVQVPRRPR